MEKQCRKCGQNKDVRDFPKYKRSKDGLFSYCKKCHNECGKEWKIKNPEKQKEIKRKWGLNNRDKVARYMREVYMTTPKSRIDSIACALVSRAFRGSQARIGLENLFGYTRHELVEHFEGLFDDKMSWDNYGSYWQVDHIIPRSAFRYESKDDSLFRECWALSNLQPLEIYANRKKANKILLTKSKEESK